MLLDLVTAVPPSSSRLAEFLLLVVGVTKLALWTVPAFCAYQGYSTRDADGDESTFWWLGAALTGGGLAGWYLG